MQPIPETADQQTAGSVYQVTLTAPTRRSPWRAVVRFLISVAALLEGSELDLAEAELVVSRVTDGVEVLRLPAGEAGPAADLLLHVRAQLREQSVEAFRRTWDITDDLG